MGEGDVTPQMPAVPCSVKGVFAVLSPAGTVPVVILTDGTPRLLPIFVGLSEAVAIQSARNGEVLPRPFTHDLFIDTLLRFGIRVVSLQIDAVNEGVYYAQLVLCGDKQEIRIDCRPSDGIALALRAGAPISVEQDVLENAGQEGVNLPPLVDIETFLK
jgi:bifunctional DNase/RNase